MELSWDEAMNMIVQRPKDIRDRHTSGAIGFLYERSAVLGGMLYAGGDR